MMFIGTVKIVIVTSGSRFLCQLDLSITRSARGGHVAARGGRCVAFIKPRRWSSCRAVRVDTTHRIVVVNGCRGRGVLHAEKRWRSRLEADEVVGAVVLLETSKVGHFTLVQQRIPIALGPRQQERFIRSPPG